MIKHIFLATILYTAALHSSTTLNGFFDEEAFDDTSYQLMILQNQAADIKDIFQTFTQIPEKYLHQINVVISELKNIKLSAPQIQNATQALRRYQVLATTCVNTLVHNSTDQSEEVAELLALFEQREEIVKKIHAIMQPVVFSLTAIQNLTQSLGYEPSAEEKKSYMEEHKTLTKKNLALVASLNKELFFIEKEILKDRRDALTKYGPLAAGAGTIVILAVLIGKMVNKVMDR